MSFLHGRPWSDVAVEWWTPVIWGRTWMSPHMKSCRTWMSRIRARLCLMTDSAKEGGKVSREDVERQREKTGRRHACSVYAMPVCATPPPLPRGTWMKWMNDGPVPQKRPSSIEPEQSIHGDEWGVNTNNNNNNGNIGGPYSYFSFIHMYAVTQTHTYGQNTMDNIPLGTPPESSWEQGCLTKHRGKGALRVQAQGGKKKSWHHVNAIGTMIGDERPSPPLRH